MNKNTKKSLLKFKQINSKYFNSHSSLIYSYYNMFMRYFSILINLNYQIFYLEFKFPRTITRINYSHKENIEYIIDMLNSIELIESSYLIYDKNKSDEKNESAFTVIFSVRPLYVNCKQLIHNIYSFFSNPPHELDILSLKHLDNNKKLNLYFSKIVGVDMKHIYFQIYSSSELIDENLSTIYSLILDNLEFIFLNMNENERLLIAPRKNKYSFLPCLSCNKINEYYVIYLWNTFLKLNNLFLATDRNELFIYKKYSLSRYSYYKKEPSSFLISEYTFIIKYFKEIFPFQFCNVNLSVIFLKYVKESYAMLLEGSWKFLDNIILNKHVVEFKDGIYLLKHDIFLSYRESNLDRYPIKSFLYIDINFIDSDLVSSNFFHEILLKINPYFRNDIFQSRKNNIKTFLLKIGKIINDLSLLNNKLYVTGDSLYVVSVLQEYIEKIVKPKKYKELLSLLGPFFILIQLFQDSYFDNDNFHRLIFEYNIKNSVINDNYGVFHPKITDYHIDNYLKFYFSLNSYYLKHTNSSKLHDINNKELLNSLLFQELTTS